MIHLGLTLNEVKLLRVIIDYMLDEIEIHPELLDAMETNKQEILSISRKYHIYELQAELEYMKG